MQLTDEQKQDIREGRPVRITEPDLELVVVRADLYERLKSLMGNQEDVDPGETYPLVDEVMREDWDRPEMAEYDNYEAHRE